MKKVFVSLLVLFMSLHNSHAGNGWVKQLGDTLTFPVVIALSDTSFFAAGSYNENLCFLPFTENQSVVSGNRYVHTGQFTEPFHLIRSQFGNGYWGVGTILNQYLIFKTDLNGQVLLCKSYNGDYTHNRKSSIVELSDGSVMACNEHQLVRLDSSGSLIWKNDFPNYFL